MIREITSSNVAREFLNSVPFDEYIPDGFPVCNEKTLILGWYDPDLVACFPCNIWGREIEIHAACLHLYRGRRAIIAGKSAINWIFKNTEFAVVFSKPNSREAACFASMCGMRRAGGRFEVRRWVDLQRMSAAF